MQNYFSQTKSVWWQRILIFLTTVILSYVLYIGMLTANHVFSQDNVSRSQNSVLQKEISESESNQSSDSSDTSFLSLFGIDDKEKDAESKTSSQSSSKSSLGIDKKAETSSLAKSATPVKIVDLSKKSDKLSTEISMSGEVRSTHALQIKSTVAGTVKKISWKKGDRVKKDDIIVDLSGDADTQDLYIQKTNLENQIFRETGRLALMRQNILDSNSISQNQTFDSLSDLQVTLTKTIEANNQAIDSLNADLQNTEEKIKNREADKKESENLRMYSKESAKINAVRSTESLLDGTWLTMQTVAKPFAELLEDIENDLDELKDDIEDMGEDLEDQIGSLSTHDIESDIVEIQSLLIESADLISELISASLEVKEDENITTQQLSSFSTYQNALSQSASTLRSSAIGLDDLVISLISYDEGSTVQLHAADSGLVDLRQRKESLLLSIERQKVQNSINEHKLQEQINNTNYQLDNIALKKSNVVDQKSADIKVLENQIANLEDQKVSLNANIQSLTIKAPYSGVITEMMTQEGEKVSPGSAIVSMMKDDREVVAFVSSSDISKISSGQKVEVSLFGESEVFDGVVAEIASFADAQSRTVEVTLDMDESFTALVGSLLDIEIVVDISNSDETSSEYFVPLDAIVYDSEKAAVFVVVGDIAQKIYVETGDILGASIQILSELPSRKIIVDGNKFVSDGETVVTTP